MSVSEMNEEHEVLSHERLTVSTRINGMGASGEPKNFPPVLVSSSGQPVLVHQQLVHGEHGVIPIASPFLTQASVFYAPSFLNQQQLAGSHHGLLHQFRHVSPLIPLHNNLPREGCSNSLNGCIQNESLPLKSDRASPSNCKKNKSASPTSVNSMKQKGREPTPLCAATAITIPSISPGTPASPQTPTTPQQTEPSPVCDEICVICSDKATGHHYGVTSCEGCKGFFKRSVQNKKVYSCRNLTQDCPVDKRHRNRCQFCRFQKCVKAGMLKEAVREDRTPGGKHKNRSLSFQSRVKPEPAKVARTNSSGSSISSMEPVQSPSTSSSTPSRTFPLLITELLRHEPCGSQLFDECEGCELEDVGQKTLAHVTQRAEEQVQKNQEWFTNLPFLQDINDRDKRILIRSAWIEMMLINLTKHSFHFENSVLLCKGQVLDFPTAQATGIGDILHRVMQLTAKFKELSLDSAEFVCIKIIVLLNPDVKGLHDQPLIERLQDKVHASLLDYNNSFYPSEPNRFGNILLRLPELRSIGTKCLERLFMLNLTGQIRASNSLSELLHTTKR